MSTTGCEKVGAEAETDYLHDGTAIPATGPFCPTAVLSLESPDEKGKDEGISEASPRAQQNRAKTEIGFLQRLVHA